MQLAQRVRFRHQHPAPDHGANAFQVDFDLEYGIQWFNLCWRRRHTRLQALDTAILPDHPTDFGTLPLEELRQLQDEYQDWLDNLPQNLEGSALHEKLEAICELYIDELDVELPLGFGRD